uniref:Ubiquitin-like domain-containing protein n=1 Tax=Rhizochromulina marina TaxID=1034831 RepID=A0A7S2SSC9_9STRA|mmetsp:Transcript_6210/g.18111  ORF Transcript_6210/g.18111 Transcript_6210/m.18111 type:complete len:310 (+) Transcript_6210:297-1226(+)
MDTVGTGEAGGACTPEQHGRGEGGANAVRLRVKTANHGDVNAEHWVTARLGDPVDRLKRRVEEVVGAQGKYLRLICSGRMLAPPTAPLSSFKLKNEDVIHAVVSDAPPRNSYPSGPTSEARVADSDSDEEEGGAGRRLGFDALRNRGLTRSGVESLRAYFASQVDEYARSQGSPLFDLQDGETEQHRRLRWEDAWIHAQSEHGEFAANFMPDPFAAPENMDATSGEGWGQVNDEVGSPLEEGSYRDFVWGFFLGFFFGVIMLFWLWEHGSYRQKMGIMAGISCQLLLRYGRDKVDGTTAEDVAGALDTP